jgi:integrase
MGIQTHSCSPTPRGDRYGTPASAGGRGAPPSPPRASRRTSGSTISGTCAALLIAQAAHPKAIQTHLGHSSIQVTLDLDGHLFPDEMDRLAEHLDAAHGAASVQIAASVRHEVEAG